MALRFLRMINHWFALAAFWGYLAAVALAFTMVLVFFPVGALILLFAGLLALPVIVVVSTGMGSWERAWCRRWLRASRCPACLQEGGVQPIGGDSGAGSARATAEAAARRADDRPLLDADAPRYECRRCGAFFAASGAAVEAPFAA